MATISFFVNAVVICVICAELLAMALGKATPNHLLVTSMLSGLLTLLSFWLSKQALQHLNRDPGVRDAPDGKVPDEA
jgi:hypothetical protein